MLYKVYFKPLLDFVAAFIGLILFSPLIIIIFTVLAVQNNGKPLFYQRRPGKDHNPFYIIKFKTMNDSIDKNGNLLPDKERITPVGHLIRKSSLDEIPQLINVIKGDMSLVGPRPLLFKYIELYSEEQDQRHKVRPGITGWAQINGRNSISWTKKFQMDIYYVNNLSFLLDMKILMKTFLKVLKSEGVNQSVARPMKPFNGLN